MKSFRELISWELEQERKNHRSFSVSSEESSGRLESCILRKIRHLSATHAAAAKTGAPLKHA